MSDITVTRKDTQPVEVVAIAAYDEDSNISVTAGEMFTHVSIEGAHIMIDTDKIHVLVKALETVRSQL